MSSKISEENIHEIVQTILQQYTKQNTEQPVQKLKIISTEENIEQDYSQCPKTTSQQAGVFRDMTSAIEAAKLAHQTLQQLKISDRERFVQAIRKITLENKEQLGQLIVEETKLGNYDDKLQKLELVASKTPGTEDLKLEAYSGDDGLTTVEYKSYGVIGAVTPVTNPVETIVNNSIGIVASGNTVVFNVHPSSVTCSKKIISLLNQAIKEQGGPENIITMVANPTMSSLQTLIDHPAVRLLIGTGGPGLVKKLLQSGKKAIGAGAGNPPVLVDETADLEIAAQEIIKGASFDNNILCIAEKEVFVVSEVADRLLYHMLNNGVLLLNQQQVEKLMGFALVTDKQQAAKSCSNSSSQAYHVNKEWVGKPVSLFLKQLNIATTDQIKLIAFECDFSHPFVQLEQMMPVLPIVRVNNLDEGIELAVKAEKGNRHTALMHSQNINNLTKFARAIESTIFVKNASSLAGVGFEGEGYTTMSIAGPTGEGLTSAKNFARKRRCVLGQGGLSL